MAGPREFDEAQVVQSATLVFWQKGYLGTSVQDLVDATGLLPGSLYGAFGDKHGLFVASLDEYMALSLRRFRELVNQADDPVEAVREFVRRGAVDCANETSVERGCMVGNSCSELVAHDEITRSRVQTFISGIYQMMADALSQGQAKGTFGADRDPDAVATFIQCSLQGLMLLAKSQPDSNAIRGVVHEVLRVLD